VSTFLTEPSVSVFLGHIEEAHNGEHDTACRACDVLWERIPFGWPVTPERTVALAGLSPTVRLTLSCKHAVLWHKTVRQVFCPSCHRNRRVAGVEFL
jgi:hypothetical protein